VRVAVLVVLLVAMAVVLRLTSQPGLAVALYGLIPIVLATFWFSLTGGLLTATVTLAAFFLDEHFTPTPGFTQVYLLLGTLNRGLVFFGVPVLVMALLRRERRLTTQLEAQRAQLAELEALRAALTPSAVPSTPGLAVATAFVPAEGTVAGDFFLVAVGPGGSTTVVVGDVVGHGLVAARSAAFLRATMSTFAQFTSDPAELLRLADTALRESGAAGPSFVTAISLSIAATPDHEVRWASAGHPLPWSLDCGTPVATGPVGPPLGVGRPGELAVQVGRAPLGAGILVFTDGLTEGRAARRPAGTPLELFGEDRARQALRELRGAPAGDVVAGLVTTLTTHADGELADDLCLVAVRPDPR
jgi:serine phosphatase RsbU (regulator of sigma subunit)